MGRYEKDKGTKSSAFIQDSQYILFYFSDLVTEN